MFGVEEEYIKKAKKIVDPIGLDKLTKVMTHSIWAIKLKDFEKLEELRQEYEKIVDEYFE